MKLFYNMLIVNTIFINTVFEFQDVSVDHHVNRNLMQDVVVNEVINEDELNHGAVLESKSDRSDYPEAQ